MKHQLLGKGLALEFQDQHILEQQAKEGLVKRDSSLALMPQPVTALYLQVKIRDKLNHWPTDGFLALSDVTNRLDACDEGGVLESAIKN